MELIEVKILLKNLLNRVETLSDGTKQLLGIITDDEVEALHKALSIIDNSSGSAITDKPITLSKQPDCIDSNPSETYVAESDIQLNLSSLSLPPSPVNVRLCLDFGTAMSKATLVEDKNEAGSEDIHVLKLGVPSDQEEISEHMLISSVYIDNKGKLWFGKAAIERSLSESGDGSRQRLDNIKRRLSEDGWDDLVGPEFNPTSIQIKHSDMVLAYMMYMTWAVNSCLEELGYPRNLNRRFAMPCLSGAKGRETVYRLRKIVGESQILADTFFQTLNEGLPLQDFVNAFTDLRSKPRDYLFVTEDITEPLGVAGSIISWKNEVNMLIMVLDIGAGTSDLSLYRIHYSPFNENNKAIEIDNSSRVITEAGNHLDQLLIELVIKKSGITRDDFMWENARNELKLRIRDYKETLFNEESVFVTLMNGTEVEIDLNEFLQLEPVQKFGKNLNSAIVDILESIDPSWIGWVKKHPSRNLVLALTGGGAELPMVRSLAEGSIRVNNIDVPVARALAFPTWLQEIDENLEYEYPRIAVSLGGARRRLMERGNVGHITAGDVTETPTLQSFPTTGNH